MWGIAEDKVDENVTILSLNTSYDEKNWEIAPVDQDSGSSDDDDPVMI